MKIQRVHGHLRIRERPRLDTKSAMILAFPVFRTWDINFYCFISHLVYGISSLKRLRQALSMAPCWIMDQFSLFQEFMLTNELCQPWYHCLKLPHLCSLPGMFCLAGWFLSHQPCAPPYSFIKCSFFHYPVYFFSIKIFFLIGTFLVVQCLRIHLPTWETRVQSLVQENSTCHRATKPVHHNY